MTAAFDSPKRATAKPSLRVVLVSDNPETLDGLQAYLQRAGVTVLTARRVEGIPSAAHAAALVLFPDDFDFARVAEKVVEHGHAHPGLLTILVTSQPKRFITEFEGLPTAQKPLVIPKPAWGWTILDAMRARLERSE